MVKIQKPIAKKLVNKPKLDNPIKQKKQQLKKEKSTATVKDIKTKLLDSPIKEAKAANKAGKDVTQKKKDVPSSKEVVKVERKHLTPQKVKEQPNSKKNKKAEVKVEKKVEVATPVKIPIPVKAAVTVKAPAPVKAPAVSTKAALPVKTAAKSAVLANAPAPEKKEEAAKVPKPSPALTSKPELPAKGKGKKKNKKTAPQVEDPIPKEPKVGKKVIQLQEKKKAKIAFKKSKLADETKPWKKAKKEQKEKKRPEKTFSYDPVPYDEEKFNAIVNVENIKKVAEALKTQVEKEVANKTSSIFEDYRYLLQVGSFKIANCPKRMVKLPLKHSLVDKDDDVLLIVPDLQRGSKVDYEPTIHHYEDLLRFHGVEGITVMPMNQLRKEFSTYEQKRRLCASYEHYLCDGRIVSHVVGLVGKIGQKPRRTFHAVRLHEEKDIKTEIEKSLRKTAYRQLAKSTLHSIPVGTHKFTSQQLAENIEHVVGRLKKVFPGGLHNVRNLYLKIDITGTSALPMYISMGQAPENTPMVMGPREQKMIKLKREANEVLANFAMTKEGKLIKLSKTEAEKKRKLFEMRAALKEDEEVPAKKVKKAKKEAVVDEKKDEVKELELPENEGDDDSSDEDDDDVVQLGSSSDDDEDNEDIAQLDQEEESLDDAESDTEIVENGLIEEGDEESEEEDQQEVNGSEDDDDEEDDDEEEDDDDDDEDEDEAEESD